MRRIRSGQCRIDVATGRYLDVSAGWLELYGGTRSGWLDGPPHLDRFQLRDPIGPVAIEWRRWHDHAVNTEEVCAVAAVTPQGLDRPIALTCHLYAAHGILTITVTDLPAAVRAGAMVEPTPTVPPHDPGPPHG